MFPEQWFVSRCDRTPTLKSLGKTATPIAAKLKHSYGERASIQVLAQALKGK